MTNDILCWLHIGDLHITRPGLDNHRDLLRITDRLRGLVRGALDFVLLPGDNADDGAPDQFALVREAIAPLALPVHILPGDHDMKPGSLRAFHEVLGAEALPKAETVNGHRCLFLDVVSAGSGGPDFRLGEEQLAWAEREVAAADAAGQPVVLFMHTYPADLREGADRLGKLLALPHVVCVDMGHTHYNELANDGRTVFTATRSTGQIEEGAVGFSVAAVDGAAVSWRFKSLGEGWPFVLVTAPVDHRLLTGRPPDAAGEVAIRAKVLADAPVAAVEARVDDGAWIPMRPAEGAAAVWQATAGRGTKVTVRARDADGRTDEDTVEPAGPGWTPPARTADGSDADRVERWPEKGVLGTQLGPNRNGRKW